MHWPFVWRCLDLKPIPPAENFIAKMPIWNEGPEFVALILRTRTKKTRPQYIEAAI